MVVAKFATVQNEGEREVERWIEYYNLDVIISVGYRVKFKRGVEFRRWANSVLKQYILKGYAVNDNRIKQLGEVIRIMKRTEEALDSKVMRQHTFLVMKNACSKFQKKNTLEIHF